jgi:hypothetical protein
MDWRNDQGLHCTILKMIDTEIRNKVDCSMAMESRLSRPKYFLVLKQTTLFWVIWGNATTTRQND